MNAVSWIPMNFISKGCPLSPMYNSAPRVKNNHNSIVKV